ncbi:MAG TPA: hypothetical protein VH210_14865 [Gaiellaceae bacterium]|jgi:hypothetical protein|nr:hypothetical protein [Gaiellaceae bacterium]
MTRRGGNRFSPITPHDALRYNEHPDQLLREVPPEEWGRTLRAIEREVKCWQAQRSTAQVVWRAHRRGPYRTTIGAVAAILAARHD